MSEPLPAASGVPLIPALHARARNSQRSSFRPPSYFVAHVAPNAEQRVCIRLRQQSFTFYYPRIKVRRSHGGKVDWAFRPFLPRYLFVEDAMRGVSEIKRTHEVSGVVCAGLEPVRVKQDVVERIRAREVDGFVQLDPLIPRERFQHGQLVRVTEGQFRGQDAIFYEMRGATRAMVFLRAVMGRVSTEVPVFALEAAV